MPMLKKNHEDRDVLQIDIFFAKSEILGKVEPPSKLDKIYPQIG